MIGESCSYFDRTHVSRIIRLGAALGKVPGFRLTASAYHCRVNTAATVIRSTSLRDGAGGAHEAFWNTFGSRLKEISEEVLLGPLVDVERQLVFAKLEDLRRNICADSAPLFSHLSVIRNEIQYRHAREVWLPSSLRKADRERLGRLISQWMRDPMAVDLSLEGSQVLGRFAVTCAFLISACASLLRRMQERAPVPSRSFALLGPLTLLSTRT